MESSNPDERQEWSKKRKGRWLKRLRTPRSFRLLIQVATLLFTMLKVLIELVKFFRD